MQILLQIMVFTLLLSTIQCSPVRLEKEHLTTKCGYESCHPTKDGYVNVHLIPHSHDDVGWVKTVDQFYYGTNMMVYKAGVVYIYDNVLRAVKKNKDRRFIYVETAFFWKWWLEQEEQEKEILKELVNNGQIEFIGGGWSMNDEAVTNYQSTIDQMSWGLKKLNDSLGDCARPKMGWQIDPFGHSNEMASIFASLGFDGVILGRIDFQDQEVRLNNKSMEMVWRGSNNLGRSSDIFTSVLYHHYDAPEGFCFDILCEDESLIDDIDSPEYNIDQKALDFILNYVQDEHTHYQTSNVIVPMGRDFAYQEAEVWFRNMDKLIKYINNMEHINGTKYHLLYSTPSCYAAAVHKESNGILKSPLKTDDFFPYGTGPHEYWTGYFTSRPTLKRFERMGNNFLQICKQLYILTNTSSEFEPKLNKLREAMGVMQHHDAITGTEKEVVAYDYARLLHIGFKNCEEVTNRALSALTNVKTSSFETCLLLNVSQCAFSEQANVFVVTVYNPLSREVNKYVRLPVLGTLYQITGPDGVRIRTQMIPISRGVQNITGRASNATVELVFEATNIPPLGYRSFYVEKSTGYDVTSEDVDDYNYHYSINQEIGFDIDRSTGLISKINMNNIDLDVDQRFWFYNGTIGYFDTYNSRPSGAYIFRPDHDHPIAKVSDTARFEVYRGDIVTEVHQTFNEFVSQVVRVYEHEKYVEFDWVVGPLIMEGFWPDSRGKEVISRFSTTLKSEATFYTDSNGREMVQRTRNFRPTWDIDVNETESSNYYPITSKIVIEDEKENIEFAILTDRAEGGSSLEDGDVELMLLRNSISDDQLGVSEALMETAFDNPIIVRGSHFVVFGHVATTTSSEQSIAATEHEIAEQKLLDSWIFLSSPAEDSFDGYRTQHSMEFSGLKNSLPRNVHIMTLEPWQKNGYLLRLEHIFEKHEDAVLSLPAKVDLKNLFTTFEIKYLRETTLGGNQWLEDNQRMNFRSLYQSDGLQAKQESISIAKEWTNDFIVTLQPMQIRTFIIEVERKPEKI